MVKPLTLFVPTIKLLLFYFIIVVVLALTSFQNFPFLNRSVVLFAFDDLALPLSYFVMSFFSRLLLLLLFLYSSSLCPNSGVPSPMNLSCFPLPSLALLFLCYLNR